MIPQTPSIGYLEADSSGYASHPGVDRDREVVTVLFHERDAAVLPM